MQEWDARKSECSFVMKEIQVETLPGTKVSLRLAGLLLRENLWNRF